MGLGMVKIFLMRVLEMNMRQMVELCLLYCPLPPSKNSYLQGFKQWSILISSIILNYLKYS